MTHSNEKNKSTEIFPEKYLLVDRLENNLKTNELKMLKLDKDVKKGTKSKCEYKGNNSKIQKTTRTKKEIKKKTSSLKVQ